MNIGEAIKTQRKLLRMTQEELASRVGFDQAQVSRVERGKVDITVTQLRKFERALNTSLANQPLDNVSLYGMQTLREVASLLTREQADSAMQIIKNAENAEYFKEPLNRSWLLFWKAKGLAHLRRNAECIAILEHLLSLRELPADPMLHAMVHTELGNILENTEEYERAYVAFKKAYDLQKSFPVLQLDNKLMYQIFYGLGSSNAYLDRLDEASLYLAKAAHYSDESLVEALGRHLKMQYTQGAVLSISGKYTEAVNVFNQVLIEYQKLGYVAAVLNCYNNIAYAMKMLGNDEESNEWYQKAVDLAIQNPDCITTDFRREMEKEGFVIPARKR